MVLTEKAVHHTSVSTFDPSRTTQVADFFFRSWRDPEDSRCTTAIIFDSNDVLLIVNYFKVNFNGFRNFVTMLKLVVKYEKTLWKSNEP